MRRRFLSAALMVALLVPASADASPWRSTVSLPDDPYRIRPLDAFVIADQLGDSLAVDAALSRAGWRAHLLHWSRGRLAWRAGNYESALDAYSSAAEHWPGDEPALVGRVFDQQRLELALQSGSRRAVRDVIRHPVLEHTDAVWSALRARAELQEGDVGDAVERFALASEAADELERRHPAFLAAPGAWLEAGEVDRAVEAWQASISVMRRPERLRMALAVWDELEGLRAGVTQAEDPGPTLRFLVRVLRRDEAMAIVRDRLEAGIGDRAEQELFVAEQMYRLRMHDELADWLASRDRSTWSDEQMASAEGYRWGVARRAGNSLEVARGFDAVAETWPGTDRAAEAWWEAAWMYELGEELDAAVKRYARHVRATDGGRFRTSAALRTGLLPWRAGDRTRALANFDHFGEELGSGMDQAAAWWLTELAGAGETALRIEHPASPFWRGPVPAVAAALAPREVALYHSQKAAFVTIASAIGAEGSLQELPRDLAAIARMAEVGLRTEASIHLTAWARGASPERRLQATWVAFRWGLPEMQARQGWFLNRRLGGRDPALDAALRVASLPTPFARAVLGVAEELDLPPALLWALMRRESFFDADVVSLAGAHGLMQLIPPTAARVARRLEMPNPTPSQLYVPSLNILLGSAYLAGLRDEANGNWIRALASYNAGERNGERWEARLRDGEPPELGILLISYSETRSYVYNVLRVAHLYEDAWRASN